MATESPLHLLLLWHQHQPLYKDGLQNRYEMPWVRLHATKDYFDMVAILDEFPTIKANFNLVPSLLAQLDDYAQNKAHDRFLELTLKAAAQLTGDDKQFLLENFFMAHWGNMIDPYPRYRELLDKRGRHSDSESLTRMQSYFKEQDWRDLQTWFNLAWFDPWWKEKDKFIRGLFEKGKHFSEDDKQALVAKQIEICGRVVQKHKELQDKGQIEVTTTPFYHPILPLLCDSDAARPGLPHVALPSPAFRHPEDADTQLQRAVDDYTRRFGMPPKGLWPSEGSVSEEALRRILDVGIQWVATDEGILAKSVTGARFRREDAHHPYRYQVGDRSIGIFFRDHELSDAIGFVYATWDPEAAAKDFVKRLRQRRDALKGSAQPALVSVILDGENCWEYYKDDGLPFLRALYRELAADPHIVTVRGSEFLQEHKNITRLEHLWPGSWINSNFAIWIGHSEDHLAWKLLLRTRQYLTQKLDLQPDLKGMPETSQAWEEIYIAEGSDWCWWYGDDHSSANDATFDYLFRKHLMNVYTLMGEQTPDDLRTPIKRKRSSLAITEPVDFITPTLDGKVTGYYEWRAAGIYNTETTSTGTMQKAENLVKSIWYGFDMRNIYFRMDFGTPITPGFMATLAIKVSLKTSKSTDFELTFKDTGEVIMKSTPATAPSTEPAGRYGKILEFAIPLTSLGQSSVTDIEASFTIFLNNLEQERWPIESSIKFTQPTPSSFAFNWQV